MDQGQGRNGTIRHCPAPSFFFLWNAEQRSKEPSSLTTKLAIIEDWGSPQQAGFTVLDERPECRNGASVYTDAQLAKFIGNS